MALKIEYVPVGDLKEYARNARTHDVDQVAQIAASIREFGFTNPVLIDENNELIAGHGRTQAAITIGLQEVPAIRLEGLSDAQKRALRISDNSIALNSGWDLELLAGEIQGLDLEGFDLDILGFSDEFLNDLIDGIDGGDGLDEGDGEAREEKIPELAKEAISKPGDIWILGRHRVMCGDSTNVSDVEKLMAGELAQLLHADPPYGMGKQSAGVENDNIYGEKLDAFQLEWWATYRTFLHEKASAYIWGNAPDLWRLWYRAGLGESEVIRFCNEIVWSKSNIAGMASPDMTHYPIASERCLFFHLGDQLQGNVNADEYPEIWDEVRGYLAEEAEAAGLKAADVKRICGVGMYSHWFTKSQFTLIPERHYRSLGEAYPGRFTKPWRELKSIWDEVKGGATRERKEGRTFFDNTHEPMIDVWNFSRVVGEERHGHATPKPVDMMIRIMKSSLPDGGLCVDPFGGSGSTLIGAELSGRTCFTMELQPQYVDVIVKRWQKETGRRARLESTGEMFDDLAKKEEQVS